MHDPVPSDPHAGPIAQTAWAGPANRSGRHSAFDDQGRPAAARALVADLGERIGAPATRTGAPIMRPCRETAGRWVECLGC